VSLRNQLTDALESARALGRSGVLRPTHPAKLVRMAGAYRHWGMSLAAAFATAGARYGNRVAIFDDDGATTFAQLDRHTDALARGLREEGVREGSVVGILCRNSRAFVEVTGALAKVGADACYLNTGFSAPQLREVLHREHAAILVHDDEFTGVAHEAGIEHCISTTTFDALIARHDSRTPLPRPAHQSRTIILTSGTTGTPKGAARDQSANAGPALALLERIPYRADETMIVAAPCFHSWGFANLLVGMLLGDTVVLERHFEPERVLATIERHQAQVLVAVPVMLMRILELPDHTRQKYDTSSLRLVPLSGSSLPGDLATHFMDAFGDVIYNLYGSTEVGYATIASPEDLRLAPNTAGRPPRGTEVRLLDEAGRQVAPGATGRIFVRSGLLFEGYTDGKSKAVLDGFMQSGDTGHVDERGLLFVDGRDDDMIVSGGENVFPGEVEDVIATHPNVSEVAVVGVADEDFGQRLKAFVVPRPGTAVDPEEIRAHVRANLARFKVPRDVELVESLPRNATGKLVKRELPS
jgi:acyl-CoA synthetase (AMP-forming)/AMP-acid ligase II